MDAGLHRSARIAAAASGATLPPETTSATFDPGSSSTFPESTAAAGPAPATSQASFAREYMKRNASRRSSSVTSTDSTPSSRHVATQFAPAYGPFIPSAIDRGWTVTGSPAFRLSCSALLSSGSTATTRAWGFAPLTAATIPDTSPPPPTGTITTSTSGTSSTISRPTVPWPAITSGSSYGWTRVRPVDSISSSRCSNAAGMSGGDVSIVAPYPRAAATFIGLAVSHITTSASMPSTAAA
jgi:hypothetical protein